MPFIVEKNVNKTLLNTIENQYELSLPKSYIDFMLNFGGFYVSYPNYIELEVNYLDDPIISIEMLYGDNIIAVNEDLLYEIEEYADAIIIGRDAGSNFFLLDKESCKILYWDKDLTYEYIGNSKEKDIICYKDEDDSPRIFIVFDSFKELELEIFKSIDMQKGHIIEEK